MGEARLFLLARIGLGCLLWLFLYNEVTLGQSATAYDRQSVFYLSAHSRALVTALSDTLDPVPIYLEDTANTADSTRPNATILATTETHIDQLPYPKQILRKSLILPGLGQYHNDQSWKIPLIYGLIGGLSYYSVFLTKQYHDYQAAYYNAVTDNNDLRFGPTPDRLMGANTNQLKSNRNFLRNRRDFMYVTIGLAYALNAVDAYVYAHLSTFDVSDDLSLRPSFDVYHLEDSEFGIEITPAGKAVPMFGFQLDFK
ncbi:MAG: DUF5683 domain-containing protein [Bacteroidetes bacterium]|nr:DUF5683 domain-containing protein [Bacteroidota bacterium]MDA1125847.1 DUF5683 domain-containing protein [Bacteroidota bacterium]